MRKTLIASLMAAAAGLAPLAWGSFPAQAKTLQLELGENGPQLRLEDECDPDFQDCDRSRRFRRGCTEERALDKADRMGIHRARIQYAGRRTIKVRGIRHGDRVSVTFGRERGCPILDRD